jgi:hypothetical protein
MNIELCKVLTKAKFALTLVQNWPYQNEIIDLYSNFFYKNHYIKSATF